MTTLIWILLVAVAVLLLMVLGVLKFRVTKQQSEMAFDHAKVGHGIKQTFVKCKGWLSHRKNKTKPDESKDEDSARQVHSVSA